MKHMKNLVCILLCLFVLTSCSTPKEENPYLTNIKEQIQSADKLFGVAYLGDVDGDFKVVQSHIQSQEYHNVYPFFGEIDASHFVEGEGSELYCIVPADKSVALKLCRAELVDATAQLRQSEELASYTDGQPILLRGNISDVTPNLMVVAAKGDETIEYAPHLSLKNGVLENQEQLVYDFSPYELMDRYNGLDEDVKWDFAGNWTCTVTEFRGEVVTLNLSLANDGLIVYTFESDTMTGSYTGNWLVMSDGRIRMELGGSTLDSDMPDASGYHTDVDAIYRWEVQDNILHLIYLNGTPLYPDATIAGFRFEPAE